MHSSAWTISKQLSYIQGIIAPNAFLTGSIPQGGLLYISQISLSASLSSPEKHVHEFQKTRTTFPKNMYVFQRKHAHIFTVLIINSLKIRSNCKLIVKLFLFRDIRKK